MIRTLRPWDDVLSLVEDRLALLLSPDSVAVMVSVVTLSLFAVSIIVPALTLSDWPTVLGVGQNAMLSLFLFALTLRDCGTPFSVASRSLFIALLILVVIVFVQSIVQWWLHDGWNGMLINTITSPSQWPGRTSPVEALLLMFTFGAGLLLKFSRKTGVVLSGILLAVVSLICAARTTSFSLDLAVVASENTMAAAVNPLLVAATTTTASLGHARQGQASAAVVVVLLLSATALRIIYTRIVSVVDERRRAELALKDREAALEKAQTIARIGSWRLFWPQGLMEWSKESYRIFGLPQNSQLSMDAVTSLIHPDDVVMFKDAWNRGLRGEIYDIEHRIIVTKETKWLRQRADFRWDSSHSECECTGTVQDITDSKLKEIELLRSRELVRKLAAHNDQIREQERTKIARELHDEMGQHLTALRLHAGMLQMQHGSQNSVYNEQLQDIKSRIDDTIDVVRSVAASLRPPALDAGLLAATRWMLESYVEHAGIKTQLESDIDELLLSEALKTAAFRILQESLTNVIRHSQATRVMVWITQDACHLTISVSDNGKGFDTEEMTPDMHFGLMGIRERVLNFQGVTLIQSAPDKGCCVSVTLPLDRVIEKKLRVD